MVAILLSLLLAPLPSRADTIGDVTELDLWEQAVNFITLGDETVRTVALGAVFMGIGCGLLGSFIVVRKLALVGDALSHAVLPGVALGFLWNLNKDPVAIFVGATIAGLIGTLTVTLIRDTTHLKEDAALGIVLSGFYAVGVMLSSMIQRLETGAKSGLDKFFFGQASALNTADVTLMGIIAGVSVAIIALFYRQFLVVSFDAGFARAIGLRYKLLHNVLMFLLAFSVVVALQATGVVLVSALLIIPAATAYLLTDRLHNLLMLAAVFGAVSGLLGCFMSYLGNNLPTGPFMVLAATIVFVFAFLLSPRHGLLSRRWRRQGRRRRIRIENTLKAVYQVMEVTHFKEGGIPLSALAARRGVSAAEVQREVELLERHGLAELSPSAGLPPYSSDRKVLLTHSGWTRACEMVRNHRLWELYLTSAANYDPDQVHEDAEIIEHLLSEDTVRDLERKLDHPNLDPHGKLIPSQEDMDRFGVPARPVEEASGYRATP